MLFGNLESKETARLYNFRYRNNAGIRCTYYAPDQAGMRLPHLLARGKSQSDKTIFADISIGPVEPLREHALQRICCRI